MNARTLLVACGVAAASAWSAPAAAYQGCFFEPTWPWESGSPIHQLESSQIDVYLDDSFYDADSGCINDIPKAIAEAYVVQGIANFHTESGASFTLDYRGRSADKACWTGAHFDRPTIIIGAVPTQSDLGDFCNTKASDIACANWTFDADGTYCGSIYFVDDSVPSTDHYWFRSTLLHELMHTFNYAHPDEDQCDARHLGYDSVTHKSNATHPTGNRPRHLTQADKRYLQDDYDINQTGQNSVYRRATWPFSDYPGFSAAALVYSNEATNGAVAATDGETHDYGFVFNEYESSEMPDPFPVSYLYRNGSGWQRQVLLSNLADENWSHYSPDVTTGRTAANRYYAAVVLGADRFADRRTDVFFQEMNFSSFGTWTNPTRMFGSRTLEEPNVALAFDPITRRYVVAYTGQRSEDSEGILRLRTRKPTSADFPVASRKIDNSGVRFMWGVDIACSPTMNAGHNSNCVAVGIQERLGNAPGRVVFRFFKLVVDANDVAQVVFEAYDEGTHVMADQSLIYSKPRVTANPVANSNPQFVYSLTQKVNLADDVQFRARIAGQNVNESVPLLKSTILRDLTPWDHLPASLGSHVYNGNAYLDAAYSAP